MEVTEVGSELRLGSLSASPSFVTLSCLLNLSDTCLYEMPSVKWKYDPHFQGYVKSK